jgi:hypothetical protein
MFSDALFIGRCTNYAEEAREIVACAGIAGRGQGRRDYPHRCGPQTIRGLCDERVRAEGKGTALGTAFGVTRGGKRPHRDRVDLPSRGDQQR